MPPVPNSVRHTLLTALTVLAGCGDTRAEGPLERLAAVHDQRSIAPRISIETRHRPCGDPGGDGADLMVSCALSPPPPDPALLALSADVSARVRARADAEALHAAGLIDLVWRGESVNSLDRSISHLTAAARLAERPAPALADLAAALLVRAEATTSPRDLLRAVDVAARAVELEPGHSAALFNLALAMDRLTLDVGAARAWTRYVEADAASGWSAEAGARAAYLADSRAAPPAASVPTDSAGVFAFAGAWPQRARLAGWDAVLAEWGEAVLKGDTAAAGAKLRTARLLGDALARRGGDATLADAVRAIESAAGEPSRTRRLARAHRSYAAGRAHLSVNRLGAARNSFASALATPLESAPLRGWIEIYHAATLVLDGRLNEGWVALDAVLRRADSARHPALAGQASAAMSTARLRAGRFEDGIEHARVAAGHYARAGEREAQGSQVYLIADAELAAGAAESGLRSMYRALTALRPFRRSPWRYNALVRLGDAAADDALLRTAIRLMDEGVAAADLAGSAIHQVEGRVGRATVRAMAGDSAGARADLSRARYLMARVESRSSREWLLTDVRLAEAALSAASHPRRAIAALDSILQAPGGTGTETRLLAALVARADARLAIGDAGAAAEDLERAAGVIARESRSMTRSSLRVALLDDARAVFDRLALHEAARDRPVRALEQVERGRLSFAAGGPVVPRMPRGEAAISYLIAGDTLLAWIVDAAGIRLVRSAVGRAELSRTLERVRAALEAGAGGETLRADLSALHDWLIAPIRPHLPRATGLVIVADAEISGVPFPALLDLATGRYLLEDYRLRFAPSLRDAAGGDRAEDAPAARAAGSAGAAVFVGDPGTGSAGFAPLPGAAAEVRTLATFYPDSELIIGDSIDTAAVTGALRRSEIFHFAGHAVFDDARPELSFLALGSGNQGGPERLTATALHGMDLRDVRIVVLAACETLRSGGGRSGGFAGFAGILMQAGVDGIVGSLWRVDDAATSRLMIEFHESFAASGDGPGSLRAAQLRLLRSGDPALASPSGWAGFSYAGR